MIKKRTAKQRKLLEAAKQYPDLSLSKQAELAGYNPKGVHKLVRDNKELASELEQINAQIDEKMRKGADFAADIVVKRLKHVAKHEQKQVVKQGDRALVKTTLDYHIKRTQPEEPVIKIDIDELRQQIINVHNQGISGDLSE